MFQPCGAIALKHNAPGTQHDTRAQRQVQVAGGITVIEQPETAIHGTADPSRDVNAVYAALKGVNAGLTLKGKTGALWLFHRWKSANASTHLPPCN